MDERQSQPSVSSFDALLTSPEYERLRGKLIRIFARRGCELPEDLADETVTRVTEKIHEIAATYEGEPVRYFYGVARNVYLEYTRRPKTVPLEENRCSTQPVDQDRARIDRVHECLEQCMDELSDYERRLITEYYQHDKGAKIVHRKQLAERLGLGLNALRIKAYRIRQRLYRCVVSRAEKGDFEAK